MKTRPRNFHGSFCFEQLKTFQYPCISTTQSVTGWSNGVASLDQNIAHVAFELWNVSYCRIKARPRDFHGSFCFVQLKTFQYPLIPRVGCCYWQLAKQKWTLAATVLGGWCFRKMMHSPLAICLLSFYVDPRPVTLHAVIEMMLQHSKLVS